MPTLFSPLQLGSLEIPNRILMAPLTRCRSEAGDVPGDLIATGTCAGVGIGFNPPKYLKPGDHVAITIEPIGTLESPVA